MRFYKEIEDKIETLTKMWTTLLIKYKKWEQKVIINRLSTNGKYKEKKKTFKLVLLVLSSGLG